MQTFVPGWTTLAEHPLALVKEYSFGPGAANALAVQLPDGGWLMMSPPPAFSAEEIAAFQALGPMRAVVENNGAHHLGLGPARRSFPSAITYATRDAAARIRKKGKDYGELESLDSLRPLLGERISFTEVAGTKVGDAVMYVHTDRGTIFYASDCIANIQELPRHPIFRLVFKWSDSAPGLKVFRIFFRFFVKDRVAARSSLIGDLRTKSPTILVPAHGAVLERPDLAPTLIGMLESVH